MVSIIIPTFNRAQLLPVAVESALRAGDETEIIVVDDASTDATAEICRTFQAPIRVVRLKKNIGLGAARNAGIRESRGEYIALLDDDDRRLPDSISSQVRALQENSEAALCYGRVFVGDCATGEASSETIPKELPSGDLFWKLLRGNFIPALSVLLRREPLFEAGLFDSRLRQVEDWDLWLRLSARHDFVSIASPVAIYRMFNSASGQLSSHRARMALAAAAVQARALHHVRARTEPLRAQECRGKFLRETRYTLMHETIDALTEGAKKSARANLLALVRLMPAILFEDDWRELVRQSFTRVEAKRLRAVRRNLWENQPSA